MFNPFSWLLGAIPARAWAALAGVILLALAGWWLRADGVADGRAEVQAEWDEARAAANAAALTEQSARQAAARETERHASRANSNTEANHAKDLARAQSAAADTRGQLDGLRNTIAALDQVAGRAPTEGPPAVCRTDDAAGIAARRSLAECASQLADVAREADHLTAQVIGLQSYVQHVAGPVCIDGLAAAQPAPQAQLR